VVPDQHQLPQGRVGSRRTGRDCEQSVLRFRSASGQCCGCCYPPPPPTLLRPLGCDPI
jgi:hypothetical protein